jgi:Hemerythrin HHE cation binding domain
MDITQLILDDHQEQRRLFAILEQIPDKELPALAAVWRRLSTFLEVHAKAEEDLFYPALLEVGHGAGGRESAAAETRHAIKDHNEIRAAVAAVAPHPVGSPEWRAAVAKANDANSDHMGEEEREGLTDFRLTASVEARHDLAVRFAAFEADNITGVVSRNVDPEAYLRKNT